MANSIIFPVDASTGIGWEPIIYLRGSDDVANTDIEIEEGPTRPATVVVESGVGQQTVLGQAATAGGNSFIDDGLAAWTVNRYQDGWVRITGGLGAGQMRRILNQTVGNDGNTATRINVDVDWDTNPDNTSIFDILPGWDVVNIPKDGGDRDWFLAKRTPLLSSSAVTYTIDMTVGIVGPTTFTFTTAPITQRPTLEDRYNRTDEDSVQQDDNIRVHPLAVLGATIRPPTGRNIQKSTIIVDLDGKRYIDRGVSRHPDAVITETYNDTTGDFDWVFTITPRDKIAQRSIRSCAVYCETEGGVSILDPWAWEVDIPNVWPSEGGRAIRSLPDGFDRQYQPNEVSFSGAFTNGSGDIVVADTERWAAILPGMTLTVDDEATTYVVSRKTSPTGVTLTVDYAGITATKSCLGFFDLKAHKALLDAIGVELASIEELHDDISAAQSVLDCEADLLSDACFHRGVKAALGLGLDREMVRWAAYSRLVYPDGAWGPPVNTTQSLCLRPTYQFDFVPEKHVKVYGQNVTIISAAGTAEIVPGSVTVRRTAAGTGVWYDASMSRPYAKPGDYFRVYLNIAAVPVTRQYRIADVSTSGGFEYLTLSTPVVTGFVAAAFRYEITNRQWPDSIVQVLAATATFVQDSRYVTSTGGFSNLAVGWTISPASVGRLGKWYRISEIISDTFLILEDHYQETGATVAWTAEDDDRAGATDRTRIVAITGESASFTAASLVVTGTNTTWNTVDADDRLFSGMRIGPNYAVNEKSVTGQNYGFWRTIDTVDSDTQVTLTIEAPRTRNTGYRAEWDDPTAAHIAIEVPRGAQFQQLEGGGFVLEGSAWGPMNDATHTASFVNASAVVTGVGTSWLSYLEPGDLISPDDVLDSMDNETWMEVLSVDLDTQVTLTTAWTLVSTGALGFTVIRPLYGSEVGQFGLSTLLLSEKAVQEIENSVAGGVEVTTRIVPNP